MLAPQTLRANPRNAPNRPKLLPLSVAALTALVVALVIGGAVWLSREPPSIRLRLPDGTPFRVVGTTYGTKHVFVYGRRYQQMLYGRVPPALQAVLGGEVVAAQSTKPGTLGLWLDAGSANLASSLRVTAVDEAGNEGADLDTDMALSPNSSVPPLPLVSVGGGSSVALSWNGHWCWQAGLLPRRSATFRFRVSRPKKGRATGFTEFSVPNPDPQPYPRWKPETLPAVRAAGPLRVSLQRLEWGLSPSRRAARAQPGEKGWTRAVFRITEGRRPADDWLVDQVTLSDAMGNTAQTGGGYNPEVVGDMSRQGDMARGEEEELSPDTLWPGEAWKVRAELVPSGSFQRDRVLVLRAIPLPRALSFDTVPVPPGRGTAQLGPARVRIFGVEQHEEQDANFDVEISGLAADQRLTIVKREGAAYHWSSGGGLRNGRQQLNVWTGPGTRTFDLCLGLERARSVEFAAQPSIGPGR